MVTLALVNGDLQLTTISNATALKQRITNRLALFVGEWFLEPTAGVDWFSVLGKSNVAAIETLVRKELAREENIVSINSVSVVLIDSLEKSQTYNKPLGMALVNYEVNSVYGVLRGFV
jgi:hypothetical protein